MEQKMYITKEDKPKGNIHDTAIRGVLMNKTALAIFLNQEINFKEKIIPQEIEYINTRFVTSKQKGRESDVIIKLKEHKIFIIFEHQSLIDYSMPYRTEEYTFEMLRQIVDKEKMHNKSYEYPSIITIVLYTGTRRWNAKRSIEIKDCIKDFKNKIGKHIVIDTSYYSDDELIKREGTVSKVIILDRLNKRKIIYNINEIILKIYKTLKNEEEKEIVENYIRSSLTELINNAQLDEVIKNINKEEGGENSMLRQTIIEMIEDGKREGELKGRREGRQEGNESGISQVAINMLKEKCDKKTIQKYTGLSYAKIAKLEKSLQSA